MSRARITSCLEALALGSLLALGGPASCGTAKYVSPEDRIGTTMHPLNDPDLRVDLSAPTAPVLLGGPLPVAVTVTNGSARPIEIDLAYPNLLYLRFTSPSATARQVLIPASVLSADLQIPPGGRATSTYYVNRYLRFDAPGTVQVSYRLVVPVRSSGDLAARGDLTYTLVKGTDDALREALSNVAVGLRSKDPKIKEEAAEALAFLETPLAIEYQARMLTIDHLEHVGIEALGRSPSPAAHALVVEMLGKGDSSVGGTAFDVLDRMGPAMPRDKVLRRLASDDPRVREAALALLEAHPDPRDRAAVSPLLDDPDPGVRDRAKAYLESLPK
jgi:hypothetical protein